MFSVISGEQKGFRSVWKAASAAGALSTREKRIGRSVCGFGITWQRSPGDDWGLLAEVLLGPGDGLAVHEEQDLLDYLFCECASA